MLDGKAHELADTGAPWIGQDVTGRIGLDFRMECEANMGQPGLDERHLLGDIS